METFEVVIISFVTVEGCNIGDNRRCYHKMVCIKVSLQSGMRKKNHLKNRIEHLKINELHVFIKYLIKKYSMIT